MERSSAASSVPSSSWDPGKLFVGGIPWEAGEAELRDHFMHYGDVVEAVIVTDRATGNPRGFAFILFSDPNAVDRVLKDNHVILGRAVEVKRARPRSEQQQNQNQHENRWQSKSGTYTNNDNNRSYGRSKKIFVGGLPPEVTEDMFKAYFKEFGNVIDVVVIYDNVTHRSRGFGFIEFELEDSVERVMQKGVHELNNKRVEVKIAVPKDVYNHRNASSNGSNYNSSVDNGAAYGYGYGYFQGGGYPTYNRFHVYAPPSVSGYAYGAAGYGGGYSIGPYGRVAYGAPVSGPRIPSNDQGVGAVRHNPVPYAGATMYPGYSNEGFGGYFSMAYGGYYPMLSGHDKGNQTGSDVQTTSVVETVTSQVESLKLDAR